MKIEGSTGIMSDVTDTPSRENYEALRIAADMIRAKLQDSTASMGPIMVSFVTGGPTAEDNGNRLGMICESLAALAGQLATGLDLASPNALSEWFDNIYSKIRAGEASS